jgi:hypothetical protein
MRRQNCRFFEPEIFPRRQDCYLVVTEITIHQQAVSGQYALAFSNSPVPYINNTYTGCVNKNLITLTPLYNFCVTLIIFTPANLASTAMALQLFQDPLSQNLLLL